MTATVLVVDDVQTNLQLLKQRLLDEYYNVITTTSAQKVVALAEENNPDAIILDIIMPELDGFDVCKALKENPKTHHIPVIMVSALNSHSDKVKGIRYGADDFMSKPIDDVMLIARIRSLISLKAINEDLRMRHNVGERIGVVDSFRLPITNVDGKILILEDNLRHGQKVKKILSQDQNALVFQEVTDLNEELIDGLDLMIIAAKGQNFDGLLIAVSLIGRTKKRDLPFLVIYEHDDRETAIKALQIGANDIIERPADPGRSIDDDELRARVYNLIAKRRYVGHLRSSVDDTMEKAVTDQLTGLYNRRYMENQLTALLERAKRGGPPVSVLIADIDHFKKVNDLFGHDVGDDVIRQFSERIASNLRPNDLACRFGGEEFVIIMPNTKEIDALGVAKRLHAAVGGAPFMISSASYAGTKEPLRVTCSIGVTLGNQPDDDPDTIFKRADQALYTAKECGRNRVESNFVSVMPNGNLYKHASGASLLSENHIDFPDNSPPPVICDPLPRTIHR